MDSLQGCGSSSHPHQSPGLIQPAQLEELTESDTKKQRQSQLRHAQYKARQERMTQH
ncbi:hypothetical protein C5167_037767 [Papaver somniferum]|uniref:Uncharacterized protein n=1 Tax=Papaver somniferum TaxID=3469 RepID=A0A4Y7IAS3_PAPSO|nr:hypothetical protein C5167_037767 [Papaver somniferum]